MKIGMVEEKCWIRWAVSIRDGYPLHGHTYLSIFLECWRSGLS
jgi:hypothetical protein